MNDGKPAYYWTSTFDESRTNIVRNANYDGNIDFNNVGYGSGSGVCPVITISKTQLG